MHKMIANAVMFEHPIQKIYSALPPPVEEMDELLACIFTGPCQPTEVQCRKILVGILEYFFPLLGLQYPYTE